MNDNFQTEVLEKISKLEADIAYIRGNMEGRNHAKKAGIEIFSIGLSLLAFGTSAVLVFFKLTGG